MKFGERGNAFAFPSRVTLAAKPTPQLFWPDKSEAGTPVAEKRRILPNLTAPEPQAELVADEIPQPRKRGRPRKVQPVPAEPIAFADPVSPPPPPAAAASVTPPTRSATRKPGVRPSKAPLAGERWKRRLGRWAR